MKKKIHIGTSGWHYKHWRGTFYPDDIPVKEHFNYYLRFFDTVEINNSFYRIPKKETFEKWKNEVPDDFVYVVKANRYITHMKKLHDTQDSLTTFLDNVSVLDEKVGAILFQLPPGWEANEERLENFLKILPDTFRYVFEFRNKTWYNETIYNLLKKYNCAFCIYELAGHQSPVIVTANLVYIRLHGPTKNKYQGSYSDSQLKEWAEFCKVQVKDNKDVFVYFDNDEKGYAAFNAKRLKELLKL